MRKGRWLFYATDFQSLMYPCFTFCRILGIFPHRSNASTIKTCKTRYILSTVIFCVFCTLELKILYDINISKIFTFKNEPPRIIERNFVFIIGGFTVVTTFILSGPRMHFIQTLLKISSKLSPKSYQNLSRLIHAKDIVGFLYLFVHVPIFAYITRTDYLRALLLQYNFSLEFIMNMLYMNCVCILKACFKQINDNLTNLGKLGTNDEPYLLSGTYHKQRNPFLLMEITALKKQHLAISDAVQMLKMVFSLQLLSTILMTFARLTFSSYFYLMRVQDVSMGSQERQNFNIFFVTTVTYYFIKIVLIVWACETGKNQAMKISSTVHDVFNSTSDKQIKYEMHLFSLQLLHCESIFSAKGLTVDATLLTTMVGGITTYILILIQFMFMSSTCDGKSVMNTS